MYTPRLVPYRCSVPPPTFTSWSSSASNRPQIFHTQRPQNVSPRASARAAPRCRRSGHGPGPRRVPFTGPNAPPIDQVPAGRGGAWGGEGGRRRRATTAARVSLHCIAPREAYRTVLRRRWRRTQASDAELSRPGNDTGGHGRRPRRREAGLGSAPEFVELQRRTGAAFKECTGGGGRGRQ